jgi:UDP-glucose 4-epimerase
MIGSAIVRCALEYDIEVLCIIRKDTKRFDNLQRSEHLKMVYADISEYAKLDITDSYDVFFHLAWDQTFGVSRDDVNTQVSNIKYTLDAVQLAKRLGCKKFIGAGSQAEYGIVTEPLKSDTPVNPLSGYGIAKYAAGKLSCLLCTQLGIKFNWVRILSVYGPLDGVNALVMYAINELRAGRSPEFSKCEQIWDYLYCDDAARAFLAMGKKGVDGKTYPLGSGNKKKLSEYLEIIRDIIAPDILLQFGKREYYPHQPMYLFADISELTNDTGWRPEITFEEGIKKIIANISNC